MANSNQSPSSATTRVTPQWQHEVGDDVVITSIVGRRISGTVKDHYVVDQDDHSAGRHRRYKIDTDENEFDVSENEIIADDSAG